MKHSSHELTFHISCSREWDTSLKLLSVLSCLLKYQRCWFGLSNSDSGTPISVTRDKGSEDTHWGKKGNIGIQAEKRRMEWREKNNLISCGHHISPSFSFCEIGRYNICLQQLWFFFFPRHSDSRNRDGLLLRVSSWWAWVRCEAKIGKTPGIESKGLFWSLKIALFIANFWRFFSVLSGEVWKYPLLTFPAYIEILNQAVFRRLSSVHGDKWMN